jgi:hypothetical protein
MVSCRIAIQNLFVQDSRPQTPREVIDALRTTFPGEWTDGTIRAHLIGLSTNHPSAHHYPHLQTFAFLTHTSDGRYALATDAAGRLGAPGTALHELTQRRPQRRHAVRSNRMSRMTERIDDLSANFAQYLREFEHRAVFGGPSVHFHVRAIERRMTHESVRAAIADEELLELIYAMLTSWGMHRMGPKGAKLVDFEPFCNGIRSQVAILEEIETLVIEDVDGVDEVADKIWRAVSRARLSASGTQIVAGTKALHHLLPDLIPPIDRTYTVRFFHENTLMPRGDEDAFREIYPALAEIASRARDHLSVNSRSPMNTSRTKIIDNAIIGYVWGKLKIVPDEEAAD